MAQLDPSIILAGSQPNFLAITGAANQMAQSKLQDARQNALQALMQSQGPQMMAGDPNALNALAAYDPQAALGIQATRQGMQIDAATFAEHQKAAADATAQAIKDSQDADAAAKAAADAEQLKAAYLGGFGMFQSGDKAGLQAYIAQKGLDQLGVTPDNFPYLAATVKGVDDALGAVAKVMPKAPDAKWVPASPEDAAKYGAAGGQIDTITGKFDPINPPSNGITVLGPDGKPTVQIGGPGKTQTAAQAALLGPDAMISQIDAILQNPDLDKSTGMMSILQKVPGTAQYDFGAKANQLSGQAFLQAFSALKGSGAITEKEGEKATQAIAALDTAQSPAAYRQSLQTLRDILAKAQQTQGVADRASAGPMDFSKMDARALGNVDVTKLSDEDVKALSDRLTELGF